jgi:hypothetical protein
MFAPISIPAVLPCGPDFQDGTQEAIARCWTVAFCSTAPAMTAMLTKWSKRSFCINSKWPGVNLLHRGERAGHTCFN